MKKIFLLFIMSMTACSSTSTLIKTELLFGLHDDVKSVNISPEQWNHFMQKEIGTRFPAGFTILDSCMGAWISEQFGATSESCKVFFIVHPKSDAVDKKVKEIIDAYKQQFHQEAVLRIETPVTFSID